MVVFVEYVININVDRYGIVTHLASEETEPNRVVFRSTFLVNDL